MDVFDPTTDRSESALVVAIERHTSHGLKPIPLSHSFYNVITVHQCISIQHSKNLKYTLKHSSRRYK